MTGQEEQDNLSGAYVLNALSDAERADFARRMEESEQMRNEVTELSDTAVALGLAVTPVPPPPRLKADLLAAIATTPQLPTATTAAEASAGDRSPDPVGTTTAVAAVTPVGAGSAEARAAQRWSRRPVAFLAVAAAAVLLLLIGGLVGRSLSAGSADQQQAVAFAELNAAPDLESIPTTMPGGGEARLVFSASLGRSALVWAGDLPPIDSDQVYELWYMGDTTQAAGLLDPDTAEQNFRVLEGTLHDGDLVGLTVEAAGGATQPTGDPVVVIDPAAAA
jgi:anti-sigma-K factor RskA